MRKWSDGFSLFYSYVTPLHIAADKAHYDVMDVLLKHGAKVRISLVVVLWGTNRLK